MNKRHYEHTLPNIRGSLSNTYERCLKVFRKYGKDSLLLSLLGFNVGCYRLIGNGKIPKSRLIQKLESGDRDIYREYISFRCYQGKVIPSIERRRKEEFELFYIP